MFYVSCVVRWGGARCVGDVVFNVCYEASSFVCLSIFPVWGVVGDGGSFVLWCEFSFLDADDVDVMFLCYVCEFGEFVLDAVYVDL